MNQEKITIGDAETQAALINADRIDELTTSFHLLIQNILNAYDIRSEDALPLKEFLTEAVQYAAYLYKNSKKAEQYQFATYYTWFAKEILDAYEQGGLRLASKVHHHALMKYYEDVEN